MGVFDRLFALGDRLLNGDLVDEGWNELAEFARSSVCFVADVPHTWLLPHCSCLVHHGGAGTVQTALRAEVPQAAEFRDSDCFGAETGGGRERAQGSSFALWIQFKKEYRFMLGHPTDDDDSSEDMDELFCNVIAAMRPTSPEILRATPAFETLRCLARPLRSLEGDFFGRSQVTTRIGSFWSHSWHGSTWQKIAFLFFSNNGPAAAAVGSASAVLGGLLYCYRILPSIFGHLGWCSIFATFTYVFTLLFWRRRQLVFLDRICISDDEKLKAEAMLSLGAFLRYSDAMLVLWDPTFMDRLWCLLELAAYLHSRKAGSKIRLTIRPTLLGPLLQITVFSLIVFNAVTTFAWVLIDGFWYFWLVVLLLSSVNFWLTAHMGRDYCRTIEKVRDDIAAFSVDKLVSWCCCVGHKDPASGMPVPCDRKIILQCIQIWFGSIEAFEHQVRSDVLRILVDQLSNQVISYGLLVTVTVPITWGYLDVVFDRFRVGEYAEGMHSLMRGLTYGLAMSPSLILLLFRLAYHLRRQRSLYLLELLASALVILCGLCIFVCIVAWDLSTFTVLLPEARIAAGLLFCVPTVAVALVVWTVVPKIKLL
ncbi:UGT80B1 [Symbiodinium necroappetens]|uniref:UGT80B1 protein n=1 Tax=Symbiodinium necroappetens TaxID=1628268 RepID=A0A812UTK1_9DINO|nr:UGT80B1 [Symbiodinium necroappetens]